MVLTWRIRMWCQWCLFCSFLAICLTLLLLVDGDMSTELSNPWIAAQFLANYTFNSAVGAGVCYPSLASPSPTDGSGGGGEGGGSESVATGQECGRPANTHQCLYLRGSAAADCVCSCAAGRERMQVVRAMRLPFCTHHTLDTVLNLTELAVVASKERCLSLLHSLQHYDELASRISCEFEHILSRYDCHNGYSTKWDCVDCKAAYKHWVCAMLIPYLHPHRYLPCRDFCFLVEQQCPYFLPDTKLQYAGEATFICTDPDIPEDLESVTEPAPYADHPHCYLPCHLGLGRRIKYLKDADDRCHRLVPSPSPQTRNSIAEIGDTSGGSDVLMMMMMTWSLVPVTLLVVFVGRSVLLGFCPFSLGLT